MFPKFRCIHRFRCICAAKTTSGLGTAIYKYIQIQNANKGGFAKSALLQSARRRPRMEGGMGSWADQGSSPSSSLGTGADLLRGSWLFHGYKCPGAADSVLWCAQSPARSTAAAERRELRKRWFSLHKPPPLPKCWVNCAPLLVCIYRTPCDPKVKGNPYGHGAALKIWAPSFLCRGSGIPDHRIT